MSRNEQTDALIGRYELGAELLSYACQGLTEEQVRSRPGPGTWSVSELVAHLLDCDLAYADRMKRVISEDDPPLPGFDQDAWLSRLGSAEMPVPEALELFAANRRWMARVLKRLDDGDFARAGTHSERGRETLAHVVATISNHVDHHLNFLYGKRGNLGVAIYPRFTRD